MLLYKIKIIEERATLNSLAISKIDTKTIKFSKKLGKPGFLYAASDHFEPTTKTVKIQVTNYLGNLSPKLKQFKIIFSGNVFTKARAGKSHTLYLLRILNFVL